MSEFKFACPVCGQHLTADSSTSGTQIDCPTCFQKIVVPQSPASGDSTLILSAAQPSKPRPSSLEAYADLGPLGRSRGRGSLVATLLLVVLVAAGGGALYVYRAQIIKTLKVIFGQASAGSSSSRIVVSAGEEANAGESAPLTRQFLER